MRPPSAFQWLIGNPVVSLTLMLGALAVIYFWFTGTLSGWFALLALVTGATAAKASERVNAYSAWKREWEGYEGRQTSSLRLPSGKVIRIIAGIGCWSLFAWWASEGANGDPALEIAITLFWIGTAVMVVAGFGRIVRGNVPKPRAAIVVSLCLPNAGGSSSVRSATLQLPEYCQNLLSDERA